MSDTPETKKPNITCKEYHKYSYSDFFKNNKPVELSGLIVVEYDNLPPDVRAALVASLTYIIETSNAGVL